MDNAGSAPPPDSGNFHGAASLAQIAYRASARAVKLRRKQGSEEPRCKPQQAFSTNEPFPTPSPGVKQPSVFVKFAP